MLNILRKIYNYLYSNYFFYYYVYDKENQKYDYEKIVCIKDYHSRL